MILPINFHTPRLILVQLRQRSDTMLAQELVLIQHLLQDARQAVLIREREQVPLAASTAAHIRHVALALGPVLNEPLHTPLESRELVDHGWFQGKRRVERDKTDETADRHLHTVARSELNGIVVETVMLVPKGDILIVGALVGHGVGDEDEVLQNKPAF